MGMSQKKWMTIGGMREAGSYDRHWCTVYGSRSFMVVLTFFSVQESWRVKLVVDHIHGISTKPLLHWPFTSASVQCPHFYNVFRSVITRTIHPTPATSVSCKKTIINC